MATVYAVKRKQSFNDYAMNFVGGGFFQTQEGAEKVQKNVNALIRDEYEVVKLNVEVVGES